MEEMIGDTFESMEDEDLDELADQEIDKILFEVTKGRKMIISCRQCNNDPNARPAWWYWRNWYHFTTRRCK